MIYKLDIAERHAYYNKYISRSMNPISLKLADYLYDLCKKMKPKYILDSGSGFSSFVFRKYKLLVPENRIISIDKSEHWLNKTRQFIRDCGLIPEDTWNWNHFWPEYAYLFEFDLILEDYAFEDRGKLLDYDLKVLRPKGIIIVDDAHKSETIDLIYKASKKYKLQVGYLKNLIDGYGRYPAVMRKK